VLINSLTSPWLGSGGAINVAAVRQALAQHVREHNYVGGEVCTLPGVYIHAAKDVCKMYGKNMLLLALRRLAEVCGLRSDHNSQVK